MLFNNPPLNVEKNLETKIIEWQNYNKWKLLNNLLMPKKFDKKFLLIYFSRDTCQLSYEIVCHSLFK